MSSLNVIREMLKCLVDGLTNKEIATRMDVSPHTVDSYARTLFTKLKVRNRGAGVEGPACVRLQTAHSPTPKCAAHPRIGRGELTFSKGLCTSIDVLPDS